MVNQSGRRRFSNYVVGDSEVPRSWMYSQGQDLPIADNVTMVDPTSYNTMQRCLPSSVTGDLTFTFQLLSRWFFLKPFKNFLWNLSRNSSPQAPHGILPGTHLIFSRSSFRNRSRVVSVERHSIPFRHSRENSLFISVAKLFVNKNSSDPMDIACWLVAQCNACF